jgi:predicted DNA-binding transcriptional regulator YafY
MEFKIEIVNINHKFELTDESKDIILNDSLNTWRLNTMSLINTLEGRETLMDRILLEHIPSSSNLEPILEAMEQNYWISFDYIKYYNNPDLKAERHERIEPYCVKLFERRWYVICHTDEKKDEKDNGIRTFSLDQISNLTVMKTTFKLPKGFRAEDYFKDVYGITTGMNGPLQTIELKVVNDRANYFRALPLHHSQKELVEKKDDEHSYFTYELRPSNDFYQALLHHAEHVEVISPETVREEMAEKVRAMAEKYQ